MWKIKNVEWDVSIEDVYDAIDEMSAEQAAEALELSVETYANMSTAERHDWAYKCFYKRPYEFFGLPDEVPVPPDLEGCEDEVSDWLSDTYGFCHRGFDVCEEEDNR